MNSDFSPTEAERSLLLTHLAALRSDRIREFLRRSDIGPLGTTKPQALDRAVGALEAEDVSWEALVDYLDEVEPSGKQHVFLYDVDADALMDWTSEAAATEKVQAANLGDLWQRRRPLAAPESIELGAISYEDGVLDIYGVAKRSYRERRPDLESEAFEGRDDLVTYVYQEKAVRSWVRLTADVGSGSISVHVSQLQRKADYEGTRDEFLNLISGWFPTNGFRAIDLGKVVKALQDLELAGTPEAESQALQYESAVGVRSSLSSAKAGQSVLRQTDGLDRAAVLMKNSGPGAGGNFYFSPPSGLGGASSRPEKAHVSIVARDNRVNFRRPLTPDMLAYVLRRIRFHSS